MSKNIKVRASINCGFDIPKWLETHLKNDNYSNEQYVLTNAKVIMSNMLNKNSKYNVDDFNYNITSVNEFNEEESQQRKEYVVMVSIDFTIAISDEVEKNVNNSEYYKKINHKFEQLALSRAKLNILNLLSDENMDIEPDPDIFDYEIISDKKGPMNAENRTNSKIIDFNSAI